MTKKTSGILLALLLVALPATLAAAHDDDDIELVHKGKLRIVTVDEDGNPHTETIEFDGDGPRPYLGVMMGRADGGGARVEDVIDESAAARAGIEKGDVIVGFDGESIEGPWDLTKHVMQSEPGRSVQLDIVRDGDRRTLDVELGEREGGMAWIGSLRKQIGPLHEHLEGLEHPHMNGPHALMRVSKPRLGVQLVNPTPELREHLGGTAETGVLVSKVLAGTPAEEAGVEVGDLIVAADGEPVGMPRDLLRALRGKSGESISLELIRDGRPTSVEAFIPKRDKEEGSFGPKA